MKLVLASNNPKKLKELGEILSPLRWGADSARAARRSWKQKRPHCTFVENALEKARHASRLTGLPALADDSGLCVDAFGGAPGVQSARYAQTSPDDPKSDARNNEKLLAELGNRTERQAHFVTVIVYVRHADDPQPIIAEGEWHGEILAKERGTAGLVMTRCSTCATSTSLPLNCPQTRRTAARIVARRWQNWSSACKPATDARETGSTRHSDRYAWQSRRADRWNRSISRPAATLAVRAAVVRTEVPLL